MTDEPVTEEPGADEAASPRVPTSLYGWLWSKLPGDRMVRVILVLLAVVAVVLVLFGWVFPWLEPRLPWVDVTVGTASAAG